MIQPAGPVSLAIEGVLSRMIIDETDIPENVCWLRDNIKSRPSAAIGGKKTYVYRLFYELFIEPIPEGKQLHHSCEQPRCCNPWHCEPVTVKEHRALHPHSPRQLKTHCKRGHAYTTENTRVISGMRRGKLVTFRTCRQCRRINKQHWLQHTKENTQ